MPQNIIIVVMAEFCMGIIFLAQSESQLTIILIRVRIIY